MASRYRSLTFYSIAIAAVAVVWLYLDLGDAPDFPAPWIALAWIVVALALVNLLFGFCAGCFMFLQLRRAGVLR